VTVWWIPGARQSRVTHSGQEASHVLPCHIIHGSATFRAFRADYVASDTPKSARKTEVVAKNTAIDTTGGKGA
jgi:hypothetical protein